MLEAGLRLELYAPSLCAPPLLTLMAYPPHTHSGGVLEVFVTSASGKTSALLQASASFPANESCSMGDCEWLDLGGWRARQAVAQLHL